MKKKMMIIGLALLAGMAQATVLTFDTGGGMPQTYGDFVTQTNMGSFSYGEAGEGFTPNVAVEYIGDGGDGLDFWTTGYGDLVNIVENEDNGERWTILRFAATLGCEVILHDMDIGNYNSGSLLIDRISITNESGTVLFQQDNFTLAGSSSGHTNMNFGSITGQVLTLVLDLQTAATTIDNDKVGLDNITFSQTGTAIVPNTVAFDGAVPSDLFPGGTEADPALYIIGLTNAYIRNFGATPLNIGYDSDNVDGYSYVHLYIQNGSTVTSGDNSRIGSFWNEAHRLVRLTDASTWTVGGRLYCPASGNDNKLEVFSGSLVSCTTLNAGGGDTGDGEIVVSNINSRIIITGDIEGGSINAYSEMTIVDHALVQVDGTSINIDNINYNDGFLAYFGDHTSDSSDPGNPRGWNGTGWQDAFAPGEEPFIYTETYCATDAEAKLLTSDLDTGFAGYDNLGGYTIYTASIPIEETLLVNENFETISQTTYASGNVASALVIDPSNSPPTSGEQDYIEGAEGYTSWNYFPTKAVDMNTVGLEWSFSVTTNNPVVSLFFDYATDGGNDKGVVYRILDADNADAVVASATGQTANVSASTASFNTTFELGAGNYKLQLTSDEFENLRGCMVDNIQLIAHPLNTTVNTWDARGDFSYDSNPNGDWSYIAMDMEFDDYTNMTFNAGVYWYYGDGNVWINTSGGSQYGIAPGQMSIHPGRDVTFAAIPSSARWTAPVFEGTGTVHVVGEFFAGDSGTMSTTVRLGTNSVWVGTVGTFDETFNVVSGDTIDFAVYGNWDSGNTPLDAQITLTTDSVAMNTLTVNSEHGAPVPALGTNEYTYGTTVACSVGSVTSGLTNYSPTGWSMTGLEPASGTTNWFETTVTNDAVLTWNWQTNYWLDVNTTGSGSVDVADGFYAAGSEQILIATPDAGWLFMGWSGDASGTNTATFTMDAPKTVMATFSDDADGDGLTNTEEAGLGSNPWKSDTDSDGFDDKTEVDYGLSPITDSSGLVDYIQNNDSTFGLYTSNVVLDVALGEVLLDIVGNEASLNLQLKTSDDLVIWTNSGLPKVWSWTVGEEKKFFRVKSAK